MRKTIYTFLLFTFLFTLIGISPTYINASSRKVSLTYYTSNGYFKSKLNRSKKKIIIKSKVNQKRGYAPSIKRDGYTFNGWYTRKNGGSKFSASTPVTKKQKLYPHWIKQYHVNSKYFIPMGIPCFSLDDYTQYWGALTISQKKKTYSSYKYTLQNSVKDVFHLDVDSISNSNSSPTYEYYFYYMECRLKNIINIHKTTSMKLFLKKLGIKRYNFNDETHTIDFIYGQSYSSKGPDDPDSEYEDVMWIIKMNKKNQLSPNTIVEFELITDWEVG